MGVVELFLILIVCGVDLQIDLIFFRKQKNFIANSYLSTLVAIIGLILYLILFDESHLLDYDLRFDLIIIFIPLVRSIMYLFAYKDESWVKKGGHFLLSLAFYYFGFHFLVKESFIWEKIILKRTIFI